MKKILFNDKYGLTQAVLEMRKTMTRRILPFEVLPFVPKEDLLKYSRYKIGEVVAVAQSYSDVLETMTKRHGGYGEEQNEFYEKWNNTPPWRNKMFVSADLMPHHIFITEIKVEQLQDISNEDCLKEGIDCVYEYPKTPSSDLIPNGYGRGFTRLGSTPRQAFAALIDKVSGKGTWESNPWVFCYKFELIDRIMENEEEAYCLIQEHLGEKIEYFQRKSVEKALLGMAAWKDEKHAKEKQQLIEKACEWLKNNMYEGTCEQILSKKPYPFMWNFIDEFKNAMEGM